MILHSTKRVVYYSRQKTRHTPTRFASKRHALCGRGARAPSASAPSHATAFPLPCPRAARRQEGSSLRHRVARCPWPTAGCEQAGQPGREWPVSCHQRRVVRAAGPDRSPRLRWAGRSPGASRLTKSRWCCHTPAGGQRAERAPTPPQPRGLASHAGGTASGWGWSLSPAPSASLRAPPKLCTRGLAPLHTQAPASWPSLLTAPRSCACAACRWRCRHSAT